MPESIAKWLPGPLISSRTDGFGRSGSRQQLHNFFEVDERYHPHAAFNDLLQNSEIKAEVVKKVIKDLEIDPEKANPMVSSYAAILRSPPKLTNEKIFASLFLSSSTFHKKNIEFRSPQKKRSGRTFNYLVVHLKTRFFL